MMTTATRKAKTPTQPPLLQEGDRVRGTSLEGKPLEGIVTQVGKKYAVLNNTAQTSVSIATAERLQAQAIPAALLHLIGKDWEEQVDAIFADRGIVNLAHTIGPKPDLTGFDRWRGWKIDFHNGTEVHLGKLDQPSSVWFFALSKFPELKGNGDITTFCQAAIDSVEDTLAIVAAGMKGETEAKQPPIAALDDEPADPYDYAPIDPVPAWFDPDNGMVEGQAIARNGKGYYRINWGEGKQSDVPGDRIAWIAPDTASMPSLAAMLPAVAASIATNAQAETDATATRLATLATEIAAIYAEAEEAEATMLNAGKAALSLYLSLGEKLLDVKANLNHGEWLPWLKTHNIQERKAQRAIAVHRGRDVLTAKHVTVTDLTLTEAMNLLSKKALKSAEPDQEFLGLKQEKSEALTPEAIEQQYALIGDHATPTWEELMTLYGTIGQASRWKKGMAVQHLTMGAPFPLYFQQRVQAWRRWQTEWRGFAVEHPLPGATPPLSDAVAILPETKALEGENQASTEITPEVQAGLDAIGLQVCTPSITPSEFNQEMWGNDSLGRMANPADDIGANGIKNGDRACSSRWLPEEAANVARIQFQGLMRHLEPEEFLKLAIAHYAAAKGWAKEEQSDALIRSVMHILEKPFHMEA